MKLYNGNKKLIIVLLVIIPTVLLVGFMLREPILLTPGADTARMIVG